MLNSKHYLNEKKGTTARVIPFFVDLFWRRQISLKKTSSDVDEVFLVGVVGLEPMTSTMSR